MAQSDRSVEIANSPTNQLEIDFALSKDSFRLFSRSDSSKQAPTDSQDQVLDFAPIPGFKIESNTANDEVKKIVRQDGKELVVTRTEKGELQSVVFKFDKPESSIRRSKDGKSWECEPPMGPGRKVIDLKVDKAGTVVLEMTDGDKRGVMTLSTDGKISVVFK